MYANFDFQELERATQESLARIYKESLDSQECVNEERCNETYCKIRKILDCPEMEKCHPFLYSLDMENVNESDTEKINKIYQLGVDRGMIDDEPKEEGGCEGTECDCADGECDCADALCGGPKDSLTNQTMMPQPVERKPIYTVMYSAQKDGHGTMGEFYSTAATIDGAKEDCLNQMMANGYNDVMVMAVDQSYPGVEDDVSDDWVDHSLDNVSPNVPPEEDETVSEDDSEEFLKQETGDTSDEGSATEEAPAEEPEKTKDTPSEDAATEEESGADENAETEETPEEEPKAEDSTEEKTEDDAKGEDVEKDEEKSEEESDSEEEKTEDSEKSETEDGDSEDDGDEKEDGEKKLTAEEKGAMKDEYTKTFKDVLKKLEIEKSVEDMTLQERTDFYEKLSEKWTKNDPADFMTDKDQEKLNKVVVKKDVE